MMCATRKAKFHQGLSDKCRSCQSPHALARRSGHIQSPKHSKRSEKSRIVPIMTRFGVLLSQSVLTSDFSHGILPFVLAVYRSHLRKTGLSGGDEKCTFASFLYWREHCVVAWSSRVACT